MPFVHTQTQLMMNLCLQRRLYLFIRGNGLLQGVLDVFVGLQQFHQLFITVIPFSFDVGYAANMLL